MRVEVLPDAEAVARRAATLMAQEARAAAEARGRFLFAVSGGTTPWRMLELLATEDVPWPLVHVFQADERIVGASDPGRNFSRLRAALLDRVQIPKIQIHPMPVQEADLTGAAARYGATLREVAGTPPALDLIHLGLGVDGHTASLVPGDPGLDAASDVAVTGPYEGRLRMTLTYPVLECARYILWVVTGSDKAHALLRMRHGDRSIPAGRVPQERAVLLADAAAGTPPG
jgi:6-phosphogluconolactonase